MAVLKAEAAAFAYTCAYMIPTCLAVRGGTGSACGAGNGASTRRLRFLRLERAFGKLLAAWVSRSALVASGARMVAHEYRAAWVGAWA